MERTEAIDQTVDSTPLAPAANDQPVATVEVKPDLEVIYKEYEAKRAAANEIRARQILEELRDNLNATLEGFDPQKGATRKKSKKPIKIDSTIEQHALYALLDRATMQFAEPKLALAVDSKGNSSFDKALSALMRELKKDARLNADEKAWILKRLNLNNGEGSHYKM